jgi:hypothetical protein
METLIAIILTFLGYFVAANFIVGMAKNSKGGFSKLFWILLAIFTLSFLFGSSSTRSSPDYSGGCCDNDDCGWGYDSCDNDNSYSYFDDDSWNDD